MKIRFLGATRQVTGSRYVLEAGGLRLLIDCGLFQERAHQGRNWEPSPIPAHTIDDLLLTHAHLDHVGLIPRLVSQGFGGPILTTPASRDLAEIILTDSAHIQEEDARFKRKRHAREKRTGKHPVVPLYTADDVAETMPLFQSVGYDATKRLNDHVTVTFREAGHILGSAMLELSVRENGEARTVVFSGDIGQRNKPIIRDPYVIERADYVIMESTYGDRDHEQAGDVDDQLCGAINATVDGGGNVLIPAFAVERAQELVYHLARLVEEDRIPHLMTFLDSPMAVNVTDVFRRHRDCMDADALAIIESGDAVLNFPGLKLVRSIGESKAINRIRGSCIIMAGSGMCTAGRIKHHLATHISRPECTVLIVGYQAAGTLGRDLVNGKKKVRIHGIERPVKARIVQIHGFSGHADRTGLLTWLGGLKTPPRRVFLTHGEEDAAEHLAGQIRKKWNRPVEVPDYQSEWELD